MCVCVSGEGEEAPRCSLRAALRLGGLRACVPVRAAKAGSSRDRRHMTPPAPRQRAARQSLSLPGARGGSGSISRARGLCEAGKRFWRGMVHLDSSSRGSAPDPGL